MLPQLIGFRANFESVLAAGVFLLSKWSYASRNFLQCDLHNCKHPCARFSLTRLNSSFVHLLIARRQSSFMSRELSCLVSFLNAHSRRGEQAAATILLKGIDDVQRSKSLDALDGMLTTRWNPSKSSKSLPLKASQLFKWAAHPAFASVDLKFCFERPFFSGSEWISNIFLNESSSCLMMNFSILLLTSRLNSSDPWVLSVDLLFDIWSDPWASSVDLFFDVWSSSAKARATFLRLIFGTVGSRFDNFFASNVLNFEWFVEVPASFQQSVLVEPVSNKVVTRKLVLAPVPFYLM